MRLFLLCLCWRYLDDETNRYFPGVGVDDGTGVGVAEGSGVAEESGDAEGSGVGVGSGAMRPERISNV